MTRPRPLVVVLLLSALALPAVALADFGPPAPFVNTQPPPPVHPTTVIAFELGNGSMANPHRIQMIRSYSDGRPPVVAEVQTPRNPGDFGLHVAHNADRDALVAWTEYGANNAATKAVFWPNAAPSPNPAHELEVGSASSASIGFAALDDARSATVLWGRGANVWTENTADVGAADPWPNAPAILVTGNPHVCSGSATAGTNDGRALFALRDFTATPNGPTNGYLRVLAWTRAPGQGFTGPQVVDGGPVPGRTAGCATLRAAVAPAGRAAIAYDTSVNQPSQSCPFTQVDRTQAHLALGPITAAGPNFSSSVVSDTSRDASDFQSLIVGQDDRIGFRWREIGGQFCEQNRPIRLNFAYTAPGQQTTTTGPPPEVFENWWFQCDGNLYFKFTPAGGSPMGTVWDTGVPSTCSAATPTPTPTATASTTATATSTAAATATATATPPGGGGIIQVPTVSAAYKSTNDGKVKMTITPSSDGDLLIALIARRSALISAAKKVSIRSYRLAARAGIPTTLTLKLKGRALRTLNRRGKLKVLVKTSLTPSAGGAPATSSKQLTFKKPG